MGEFPTVHTDREDWSDTECPAVVHLRAEQARGKGGRCVCVRVCVCACLCLCAALYDPWFCSSLQRLRLTEAINRSLSETPSHNPKVSTTFLCFLETVLLNRSSKVSYMLEEHGVYVLVGSKMWSLYLDISGFFICWFPTRKHCFNQVFFTHHSYQWDGPSMPVARQTTKYS